MYKVRRESFHLDDGDDMEQAARGLRQVQLQCLNAIWTETWIDKASKDMSKLQAKCLVLIGTLVSIDRSG